MGLIAALIIGIIGMIFAPELLKFLGAEPNVVKEGTLFARLMLGGNFVVVFLFLLNSIFRGAGDATIAMRVLWLSNILNCILDPLLIFGIWIFPELGVTGAAVATLIGRGIGVIYAFYKLFYSEKRFEIHAKHWIFDPERFKRLFKLSWVAILQFAIGTTSWIGLMRVIAGFGSQACGGLYNWDSGNNFCFAALNWFE